MTAERRYWPATLASRMLAWSLAVMAIGGPALWLATNGAIRALSEEETIQRLEEASGYSEDFPEMYVAVEDEIVDSFSDTVIYADLLVYSASPAGYAVEGQEIKATLFIQNQSDHPVAVAAAIVLPSQDVFKHSEKAYFSSSCDSVPSFMTRAFSRLRLPSECVVST